MPILSWLSREEDIRAARRVPYRLLEEAPDLSAGDPDAANMLIQGDNLDALKALLPFYAGRVKCIYIDPLPDSREDGTVRGRRPLRGGRSAALRTPYYGTRRRCLSRRRQRWRSCAPLARHGPWPCRVSLLALVPDDDGDVPRLGHGAKLQQSGHDAAQAGAVTEAIRAAVAEGVATKAGLAAVELRLTWRNSGRSGSASGACERRGPDARVMECARGRDLTEPWSAHWS